jgi:phospholipid-binding lipoprotein MlaA
MKKINCLLIILSILLLNFSPALADSSNAAADTESIIPEDAIKSEEPDAAVTLPEGTQDIIRQVQDPNEEQPEEAEDWIAEEDEQEVVEIADPIYPWNKAMYHFNDKLYFWVLKPVSKGYTKVVPEDIRLSVSNFFENITTPIRFVGNLMQFKIKKAGNELIRFVYNSTAGIGGLADVARTDLDIRRSDEDLGQTLGHYGIGHGFYIVWPFLGPSSLRDTIGRVGDNFLDPVSYVTPFESRIGINVYDKVNDLSFRIGDYEDLKKSAIDPYVSIRDAYTQYRKKKVEE